MKNQKGFSLIELLVVVIIIAIIAAIAIPSLLASRRAANHSATVANMRTVISAQATYASLNAGDYATLGELNTGQFIDDSWAAGTVTKNGYTYAVNPANPGTGYCLGANPGSASDGDYRYAASHQGVIYRADQGGAAPTCDPADGAITGGTGLIVLGSN